MFNRKMTKIVSAPAEEVLEVVAPEPEPEIIIEPEPEPVEIAIYNIEQLTINRQNDEKAYGDLYDSKGNVYKYAWDKKLRRIDSLTGENVDYLIWHLCESVLIKYWVRPEPVKAEEPIEAKLASALSVALTPFVNTIKSLENKVNNIKPVAAPVQQQASRPNIVQSSQASETLATNVTDDDISINAERMLQKLGSDDLSIDFMSL